MPRRSLLLLAVAAACGKSSSEPPAHKSERPALEIAWLGDRGTALVLRGAANYDRFEQLELVLDVSGAEPGWVFHGIKFDAGSKLVVGSASAVAAADGTLDLRVPAMASLEKVPVEGLVTEKALIDPSLSISLTPAGEPTQELAWPPTDVRLALLEWIGREAGAGRPLALGGTPSPGTPATTLMPQRPALVVGPGTTLGTVDRIAIYKAAVQNMVCEKYVGGRYKTPIDIPIMLEQRRFELHDRRTGAVDGEGALTATFKCPTTITTDEFRPGMNVRLKADEIRAWLATHSEPKP